MNRHYQRAIASFALIVMTKPSFARSSETRPSYDKLAIDSAYLAATSVAIMGSLWLLSPEDSQWYDKPRLEPASIRSAWLKNIRSGPVWDGDRRFFNGYGHIHTGAAYTTLCLADGLSEGACMLYANLASLAWEYGPEALVEIPSYQDLLMTGLVGSRVGLQFYRWQKLINHADGKLLGSSYLGATISFLLNPFGSLFANLPGSSHSPAGSVMATPLYMPFHPQSRDSQNSFGYLIKATF